MPAAGWDRCISGLYVNAGPSFPRILSGGLCLTSASFFTCALSYTCPGGLWRPPECSLSSPSPLHGPLWPPQAHSAVCSSQGSWVQPGSPSHDCLDARPQKQTLVSLASHSRDRRPHSLVSSVLKTSCFAFFCIALDRRVNLVPLLHPGTS